MIGVEKRHVTRVGKNIICRGGGGINIDFGPKFRPLHFLISDQSESVVRISNTVRIPCSLLVECMALPAFQMAAGVN